MDKQEELRQWFSLAEQNLRFAKNGAITMHPMPVETICNLCQQSAEKDLKGYLFLNDVEFPKTHDLAVLVVMCGNINPDFMKFIKQCQYLTKFAVMPKYPNQLQIIEDDAKTAIRFAEEIKEFVVNITQIINN
ncbi:MAG: HEPN domain-containing protein [Firmicutes bacterium]|nr:HEPN domain-containing protein [Bacillota bacterium]